MRRWTRSRFIAHGATTPPIIAGCTTRGVVLARRPWPAGESPVLVGAPP